MTDSKNGKDIRVEFKNFDPSVLLQVVEVAQLIGAKNAASVYAALYRGDLPEPMIRRNRQLRWSVGQVRTHLQELEQEFRKRQADATSAASGANVVQRLDSLGSKEKQRHGRPRNSVRPFSVE